MIDKNAERILDQFPRATPGTYDMPRVERNAVVCIDSIGRLHILTEWGIVTIDEDDLDVFDATGYYK